MNEEIQPPRSVLFVPASQPRMVAKAASLPADLIVLDLEDAVAAGAKLAARDALRDAAASLGAGKVAVRVNAAGTAWHADDMAAAQASGAAFVVLPKVESPLRSVASAMPIIAMIETPAGVLRSGAIAGSDGVVGLMAGTNDLAAALRLPARAPRTAMATALQMIVLAARANGRWAIDGVYGRLGDPSGLTAECEEGRTLGFDGKSLIHPEQVAIANRCFSPSEEEREHARALVEAARGGAERFGDRMIEDLHVAAARALLARPYA